MRLPAVAKVERHTFGEGFDAGAHARPRSFPALKHPVHDGEHDLNWRIVFTGEPALRCALVSIADCRDVSCCFVRP